MIFIPKRNTERELLYSVFNSIIRGKKKLTVRAGQVVSILRFGMIAPLKT